MSMADAPIRPKPNIKKQPEREPPRPDRLQPLPRLSVIQATASLRGPTLARFLRRRCHGAAASLGSSDIEWVYGNTADCRGKHCPTRLVSGCWHTAFKALGESEEPNPADQSAVAGITEHQRAEFGSPVTSASCGGDRCRSQLSGLQR